MIARTFAAAPRRAGAVLALAVGLWLALPAHPAWAHATLLASTPPSGYAVPTPPAELTLDFDQPVSTGAAPLELRDTAGRPYPLGLPTLSVGGRRLTAAVPERLGEGGYRVHWRVTADDGDLVSGIITFTVGTGAVPAAGEDAGGSVDSPLVIGLRWVLFSGLFLALGGVVGDRLVRRIAGEAAALEVGLARPAPLLGVGGGLGAAAAVGLALDQVGFGFARLLSTLAGLVLVAEIPGFGGAAACALLARARRPTLNTAAGGVALLAVVVAEGWRAHPHADAPVWGTALTIAHLLAASAWAGALVHVLRTARAWRAQLGWTRLLVYDYARMATALVGVVVGTGTLEALIVLPSPGSLLDTRYGAVLLIKLALVATVVALAWLARRRLASSRHTSTVHPLGRGARGETAALAGVLAVTAVLVSLPPPRPASAALAAPPAVSGPVVPVGTLAGQVTVTATAASGQLVIRMSTPDRDDLGTDTSTGTANGTQNRDSTTVRPAPYRVAATLTLAGQNPRALTLLGCGAGCFTTPVAWAPGMNHLVLGIAAGRWHGGVANLAIPWPPRPDPGILPAVLAAMRSVPSIVVHEAVTSDYAGYPGTETALTMSPAFFLSTEPYGSGGGEAIVLASSPTETEIGLGYPQGQVVRLFLGPDHRILREEYLTPNHLITRTFEYPGDQ